MERIKVLIADDMQMIAESIKESVLSKDKFNIVGVATNGEEEYNMILNLQPDIVFTDNQMPKMNGIEVIEMINQLGLKSKPKFIFISSSIDSNLYSKCAELDIISILSKPISNERLLEILDEIIDMKDNPIVKPKEEPVKKDSFLTKLLKKTKEKKKIETEIKNKSQTLNEWHEKYLNKGVINIMKYLDSNDIEILKKLGIEIENKLYSCHNFDVIDGELILYYINDDMTEEEMKESKTLESTDVTRSEYNWVLKKFENMQNEIKYID